MKGGKFDAEVSGVGVVKRSAKTKRSWDESISFDFVWDANAPKLVEKCHSFERGVSQLITMTNDRCLVHLTRRLLHDSQMNGHSVTWLFRTHLLGISSFKLDNEQR